MVTSTSNERLYTKLLRRSRRSGFPSASLVQMLGFAGYTLITNKHNFSYSYCKSKYLRYADLNLGHRKFHLTQKHHIQNVNCVASNNFLLKKSIKSQKYSKNL